VVEPPACRHFLRSCFSRAQIASRERPFCLAMSRDGGSSDRGVRQRWFRTKYRVLAFIQSEPLFSFIAVAIIAVRRAPIPPQLRSLGSPWACSDTDGSQNAMGFLLVLWPYFNE
jgi:hypothetical protein